MTHGQAMNFRQIVGFKHQFNKKMSWGKQGTNSSVNEARAKEWC